MFSYLRYILVICLLCFSTKLLSQELELLKSELPALSGKNKVDHYLKLAVLYAEKYGQPDSVISYSSKASVLSTNVNYKDGVIRAKLYTSIGYEQENDFDKAIALLKELLTSKDNSAIKGKVYYHLGQTYYRYGDNKKAIENLIQSVEFYKSVNDEDGLILAYCKLADALEHDLQHEEANKYKNKALELLPKIKNAYPKLISLSIISSIYFDLRESNPRNLDTSIIFAQDAFRLMKESGYYMKANRILNTISDAFYVKQDYNNALLYCKESLKYRKFLLPGEIIMSYMKYSDCSSALGQNENALIYLDSIKLTLPFINVQYYRLGYYERYYEYNKDAGNHTKAYEGVKHFIQLKDSLFNVEKSTAINELMQKYNKVENEKMIGELNQQKEIDRLQIRSLFSFIGIAILIIIIIIFFYRQSIIKNELKTIETEQRLNRARMNPHFFFNALASLQNLALADNKKEQVPSFISKFSKIMRQSLESTFNEMDTVENEIAFLTDYLELQKLRSENRFSYEFKIENDVEPNELLIPGMILQPFIENSIEHGFKNKVSEGLIQIDFRLQSNNLKVTIEDNGNGFQTESHKGYPSRATQIIKDRLFLLNKKYKTNATFVISNKADQKGFKVEILLPIIYKT